ncbi:MAG: hypothetical protein IT205_04955 [Fimbriimonadaceae bacterium]|nr:hypothetical protein [Fimbriimonadaceae bacterium]
MKPELGRMKVGLGGEQSPDGRMQAGNVRMKLRQVLTTPPGPLTGVRGRDGALTPCPVSG